MKRFLSFGNAIKCGRQAAGMSQEEFSQGICDPTTLSRIETGRQAPSNARAAALLERLERSPHRAWFIDRNQAVEEVIRLIHEIYDAYHRFEAAEGEEKRLAREAYLARLPEAEAELKRASEDLYRIHHVYWQAFRVFMGGPDGEAYPVERQIELLLEVVRDILPAFDLDNISRCCYYYSEIELVAKIADLYRELGDEARFFSIIGQLIRHMQEHGYSMEYSLIYQPGVVKLYLALLREGGRWEDAIQMAERGRRASAIRRRPSDLYTYLRVEAECWAKAGDPERSQAAYFQLHSLCLALGWEGRAQEAAEHLAVPVQS